MQDVNELLLEGRISEAIEVCLIEYKNNKKKYEAIIHLKNRLRQIAQDEISGLMTKEEIQVHKSRVVSGIYNLSNNYDYDQENPPDSGFGKLKLVFKYNDAQLFNSIEKESKNLILKPPREINVNQDFIFDANITLIKGDYQSNRFNDSYGLALLFTREDKFELAGSILHLLVDGSKCGCVISSHGKWNVLSKPRKLRLNNGSNNFSISRVSGKIECSINETIVLTGLDMLFEFGHAYPGLFLGNSRSIQLDKFSVYCEDSYE